MYRVCLYRPTKKCNLSCRYCYSELNNPDKEELENWDCVRTLKHLVTKFVRPSKFIFLGGETTEVGIDKFSEMCEILKSSEYVKSIALQTNALNINEEWIKLFEKYKVRIGTSYDGPVSYRQLKGGIDASHLIKERILWMGDRMVETLGEAYRPKIITQLIPLVPIEELVEDLIDFKTDIEARVPYNFSSGDKLAKKLGYSCNAEYYSHWLNYAPRKLYEAGGLVDQTIQHMIAGIHDKEKLIRVCEFIECTLMKEFIICVDGAGDVYPCNTLANPNYKLGNIFVDDFWDVKYSDKYISMQKRYKAIFDGVCKGCPVWGACFGGCYGDISSMDGRPTKCDSIKVLYYNTLHMMNTDKELYKYYYNRHKRASERLVQYSEYKEEINKSDELL